MSRSLALAALLTASGCVVPEPDFAGANLGCGAGDACPPGHECQGEVCVDIREPAGGEVGDEAPGEDGGDQSEGAEEETPAQGGDDGGEEVGESEASDGGEADGGSEAEGEGEAGEEGESEEGEEGGEGEGEPPVEGEGEPPVEGEGEGEPPVEGEGEGEPPRPCEALEGQPCGEGVCAGGRTFCDPDDVTGVLCDNAGVQPGDEICDGLDNDCDGTVDDPDEIRPPGDEPCGLEGEMVCAGGTYECQAEQGWQCVGIEYGVAEDCDGLDNDCDGVFDEGLEREGEDCEVAEGCELPGVLTCLEQVWACQVDPNAEIPADDDCDAVDDDCDALTDEDFPNGVDCEDRDAAGCYVAGRQICEGGEVRCIPRQTECENDENSCQDEQDNDRDDLEDCADPSCAAVFACEVVGDPNEPCDGQDNDDDGYVDDHARCPRTHFCRGGRCQPGLPQDPLEDNDTFNDARPIAFGVHPNLSVHDDDPDYFRLPECEFGGTITVEIRFTHAQGDVDVEIRSANNEVLMQSATNTDDETVANDVPRGGAVNVVHVYLFQNDPGQGNQYTMKISAQGCGQDDPPGDDGCPTLGATRCVGDAVQYCQIAEDGTQGWSQEFECQRAQACAGGFCPGNQCQGCQIDADCADGHRCLPKHFDEALTACMRDCSLGCPEGTFCLENRCQPWSPAPQCSADGSQVEFKDGCDAVVSEDACDQRTQCYGRGCIPPGLQCAGCAQPADCAEGHLCVGLQSDAAPDGVWGICMQACPAGTPCPDEPPQGPGWSCQDMEIQGQAERICFPEESAGCHMGDNWRYLCERPIDVNRNCPNDCNQEGCN